MIFQKIEIFGDAHHSSLLSIQNQLALAQRVLAASLKLPETGSWERDELGAYACSPTRRLDQLVLSRGGLVERLVTEQSGTHQCSSIHLLGHVFQGP